MTLEQINALTLNDSLAELFTRLLAGKEYSVETPEGVESLGYVDFEIIGAGKPTLSELEAEFLIYKQELIDQENARLSEVARLKNLKDRLAAISDKRAAFYSLYKDIPNCELWLKKNILQASPEDAEQNLLALEAADASERLIRENKESRKQIKEKGRLAASACAGAMAIINGYGQSLSESEETTLIAEHGSALQLLQLNKAWSFKAYIQAVDPSVDVVITEDIKRDILDELSEYGI